MTEYWVSQGNKWCEFCKIFIANNSSSIRNHELGRRHKESVNERLTSIKKDNAAKEKELKNAAIALHQIETKANRSYQKDVTDFRHTRDANIQALDVHGDGPDPNKFSAVLGVDWVFDKKLGYYHSPDTGYYYDPTSGFYYSDSIGKWVAQEEAVSLLHKSSPLKKPSLHNSALKASEEVTKGTPPGLVVSNPLNPTRSIKGAPSSVIVTKRKRQEDHKPKQVSTEEAAALKAREEAKKRVEKREKHLLGLYNI